MTATPGALGPTLVESLRKRRGHDFYPPLSERLEMPALYETEPIRAALKVVRLHYFVGGSDWWIVEVDWSDGTAFGFCDMGHGEWGYVDLVELEAIAVGPFQQPVERDLHFTPTPFAQTRGGTPST